MQTFQFYHTALEERTRAHVPMATLIAYATGNLVLNVLNILWCVSLT
jgi:hypothetical protein